MKSKFGILQDVSVGEGSRVYPQVNLYKCQIGKNTKVDAFVYMEENVKIGDNCIIRAFTFIPTGVIIRNNVFIGPNVTFTNDKHPPHRKLWATLVKEGASIGAGSTILPGVIIGEKALVGAGSVVTRDVADGVTVAGNPASELKVDRKS